MLYTYNHHHHHPHHQQQQFNLYSNASCTELIQCCNFHVAFKCRIQNFRILMETIIYLEDRWKRDTETLVHPFTYTQITTNMEKKVKKKCVSKIHNVTNFLYCVYCIIARPLSIYCTRFIENLSLSNAKHSCILHLYGIQQV